MKKTVVSLKTELCYHVEVDGPIYDKKIAVLQWILKEPQQDHPLERQSVWDSAVATGKDFIIEIGPRLELIDNLLIYK